MATDRAEPGGRPEMAYRTIGDLFYETRVLMGREFTLQRFAEEVLDGAVDAVMLGYVEKGQRVPSEALVRRLAAVRKQSPRELLVLLARDRILKSIAKELGKLLDAPESVDGVTDAELAVRLSQAIAALPDDEGWISLAAWRKAYRAPPKRRKNQPPLDAQRAKQVEAVLTDHGLIEIKGARVRRRGRHYEPQDLEQRRALAMEYCLLFSTGLLDRLALADVDTGTYLRNHYLNIDRERVPEFQKELDEALRELAKKYASEASADTDFLNILATATLRRKG